MTRWLAISLLFGSFLVQCAGQQSYVWYSEVPAAQDLKARTAIAAGDTILVQVQQQPDLSGEFTVGAAGSYNHPLVGLVKVAELEPEQAATVLAEKLSKFIEKPAVTVTLIAFRPLMVTVVGEVGSPGSFEVTQGAGLLQVLGTAGGLTDFASDDEIYVVRTKPKPMRIRFRYSDLTLPEPTAAGFALRDGDIVIVE